MNYVVRRESYGWSVGFWLDELRWIESSNWYLASRAHEEADRLNAVVKGISQQQLSL